MILFMMIIATASFNTAYLKLDIYKNNVILSIKSPGGLYGAYKILFVG